MCVCVCVCALTTVGVFFIKTCNIISTHVRVCVGGCVRQKGIYYNILFQKASRSALGPTQPPIQSVPVAPSAGQSG
jgi:hypothetical protein